MRAEGRRCGCPARQRTADSGSEHCRQAPASFMKREQARGSAASMQMRACAAGVRGEGGKDRQRVVCAARKMAPPPPPPHEEVQQRHAAVRAPLCEQRGSTSFLQPRAASDVVACSLSCHPRADRFAKRSSYAYAAQRRLLPSSTSIRPATPRPPCECHAAADAASIDTHVEGGNVSEARSMAACFARYAADAHAAAGVMR